MKVVVLQSNYIPWKGYFDLIHDADVFVYYDEVKYTKNDWRNRNKIYSSNGLQWLTIPISKEAVKLKISEVEIPEHSWQDLHYKSIYYAYKKAPYFRQIEPLIQEVYLDRRWKSLVDLNRYLIEKIAAAIGLSAIFADSKNFDLSGEKINRLINILKQLKATEYISGPAAKDYLSGAEHLFDQNGIRLTYKNYDAYPVYKQMREPFNHGVSILDLMVNLKLENIQDYIWNAKAV